ncbi:MAG TPA: KTSC domain-containing protein [Longimicrobium sp.]|nr:KTSC domain-containing protein [Longimicrobium sp.]
MKRERLDSSSLASAGYDPAAHVLEVEFHNGGVYQYLEVEDEEYQAFSTAPSKGRYLNTEIKPDHPARKLTSPRSRR